MINPLKEMEREIQPKLPSIVEMLNEAQDSNISLQSSQEKDQKYLALDPSQKITLNFGLQANLLYNQPAKLKKTREESFLFVNFDTATLKDEKHEKKKTNVMSWKFEKDIQENKGRKGKKKEWQNDIKKFYK
jgi:hypothetical protein